MRQVHLSIILILFVITPALTVAMETTTRFSHSSSHEVHPDGLLDNLGAPNIIPEEDIALDMMFFTETSSSGSGLYYSCRRGADVVAYFGASMVKYLSGDTVFTLEFLGSNSVVPSGEAATGSVTNYLYGSDPSAWKTGIKDCSALRYSEIYPGIDLVYKIQDGHLKYEFAVSPYADPQVINLQYTDADSIAVENEGLMISKDHYQLFDVDLKVFQGTYEACPIGCSFSLDESGIVSFDLDEYDTSTELVIDPITLGYSTFFGGSGTGTVTEYGVDIAVDDGYAYITGVTARPNFPMYNAYNSTFGGEHDSFLIKFDRDGQSLIYSTFLGGSGEDRAWSIALDDGYPYITGSTNSADFPTANAYDSTLGGVSYDCFLTKFSQNGQSLIYSTYLGGSANEHGYGIAVEDGSPYIAGWTASSDFPTVNAYDSGRTGISDCFVTKFNNDGQDLAYSTYLGGSAGDYAYGIAVESGHAYVTGYTTSPDFPLSGAFDSTYGSPDECFVTKFATTGQSLDYSTFLGGSSSDRAEDIAVENGDAYVTGYTSSSDFPTANAYNSTYGGGQDCFVTKIASTGVLSYSTYLGGSVDDHGYGIAVDNGCVHVTGETDSANFPTVDAIYSSDEGFWEDCFVTKFASDGQSLIYSTCIGGSGADSGYGIAVWSGYAYITGVVRSLAFPVVNPYDASLASPDCFLSVFSYDTDCDSLTDWEEEYMYGSNPLYIDTDNDNFLDGYEALYGTDPTDPNDYPAMPQAWYDAIYEHLDGNATLIQNLITWSDGNATILQTVIQQMEANATLLQEVISWLDGNLTAIETMFTFVEGNATLLMQIVDSVNANSAQLTLLAGLITQNADLLSTLNTTHIGDINQIQAVLDLLGVTVGDTDYDGLDDLTEISIGTDIQCIDTDTDNLNDAYEVKIGTDPLDDDSDGDSYLDGAEILAGTDPLDATDYPGVSTPTTTTTPPTGTLPPPDDFSSLAIVIVITGAGVGISIVVVFFLRKRRAGG